MTSTFFQRLLIIILLAGTVPTLWAQEYKYEIGGMAGGAFYMGDANKNTIFKGMNPAVGAVFRYNINFRWALKANLMWGQVSGKTEGMENVFPNNAQTSFNRSIMAVSYTHLFDTIGFKNGFRSARTVIFNRVSSSATCFNCIHKKRGTGELVVVNLINLFGSLSTIWKVILPTGSTAKLQVSLSNSKFFILSCGMRSLIRSKLERSDNIVKIRSSLCGICLTSLTNSSVIECFFVYYLFRVPVSRIFTPFLKNRDLRLIDVMRTDSFFQDSVVVTQCSQCYFSVLESGFRYKMCIRDRPTW